jgi:hypothetical protein
LTLPIRPATWKGGSKQLPRQSAELAGEDLGEHLDLPVSRGGLDDEGGLAVALVDRRGPHEDPAPFTPARSVSPQRPFVTEKPTSPRQNS